MTIVMIMIINIAAAFIFNHLQSAMESAMKCLDVEFFLWSLSFSASV